MNIPASTFMSVSNLQYVGKTQSANNVYQNEEKQNAQNGNKTLSENLTSIKNDPVTLAPPTSFFSKVTHTLGKIADATGLSRMASMVVNVSNTVGRLVSIAGGVSKIAPYIVAGAQIVEYGIPRLINDLVTLLKGQAWNIIDAWLTAIIQLGKKGTVSQAILLLGPILSQNQEINQLYKGVIGG